jgi:DNA-directed RNA polymerase specialized sigma24 family protein
MTRYHLRALIPPLRRYARLMTGDAAVADVIVLGCLRDAAPGLRGGEMYRLMLFRALTGALAVHSVAHAPALDSIARNLPRTDAALAAAACALPFVERSVLALVAVEGLAPGEVAAVLQMPVRLVERSLESALDRLSPIPGALLTGRASLA